MKQITCPNCGRNYPEDAMYCPGCKQPNDVVIKDGTNLTVKDSHINNSHDNNRLSAWYTFASIMIILGAIGVLLTFILCSIDNNYTPLIFAVSGYLIELGLWAIVQLMAKIERNTRKNK